MREKDVLLPSFEQSKKETEKRLRIINLLRPKLESWTEALILVGSMAYGRNFSVRKESDIDLIILINKDSINNILNQVFFERSLEFEEAISLFKKNIIQHFTLIKKIESVEVQFHFWDKAAHFKAEKLEEPWPLWYCPLKRDKHYLRGNDLEGNEHKVEIKNVKKLKYGDVFTIPSYFIDDGRFISGVIVNNFLSDPQIIYTKDNNLQNNINIMWKKVAERFINENIFFKDSERFLEFIYGSWNFSRDSKIKIKKRLIDEIKKIKGERN